MPKPKPTPSPPKFDPSHPLAEVALKNPQVTPRTPLAKTSEKEATLSNGRTLQDMIRTGDYFARLGVHGYLEIVDAKTLEVEALVSPGPIGGKLPVVERYIMPDGKEILLDKTVPKDALSESKPYKYHPWIVDRFCQLVAEGKSITKICSLPDMPSYAVLCSWRRKYPEVERKISEARLDRTEWLRDQALDEALEVVDHKFPTQAARLKFDALTWAAGVDNPKYSPKAKVEASITAPVQIVIATGVPDKDPIKEAREAPMEVLAGEIGGELGTTGELDDTGEF